MKSSEYAAKNGLLLALALILGYLESMLPAFFAVPGMKLGIPNIVVLYALYHRGLREAFLINILRIIIISLLFGNGAAFIYSMAGGILSIAVMALAKEHMGLKMTGTSILGGLFHNLGQLLAAGLLLKSFSVVWYLPVLWFAGIVSGLAVGLVCGILCRKLEKAERS